MDLRLAGSWCTVTHLNHSVNSQHENACLQNIACRAIFCALEDADTVNG